MNFESLSAYGSTSEIQNINDTQAVSRRSAYGSSLSASGASGRDTVSISSEAMEKYLAMKNADGAENNTEKVAMNKLADYIVNAPRNASIIERTDVPSASKAWVDVPFDVLAAMESSK